MASIVLVAVLAVVVMLAVWQVQQQTRNAGWVDVAWSWLMAAAALIHAVGGSGAAVPRIVVGVLGATWGIRLGAHLARRVAREPEDGRYRHLRGIIGDHAGK